MRHKRANPDQVVARIAARQHGVVSVRQLLTAGVSRSSVRRRVRIGRLHRIYRGVYAVGHPGLSQEGRWMAAVLTYGEGAVLSHRAAAALWGLLPSANGLLDVTVRGDTGRRKRARIRIRRSSSLQSVDVTRRRGVPVTTPARTIADLRRVAPALARRALRQAAVVGLPASEAVEADRTRSELEARFLGLCRRHRLPMPEVNVRVGPYLVDFLWCEQRLIVETDGYRYHRGRQAFEDDRARDLKLRRLGFEVLRVTFRQLDGEKAEVFRALRSALHSD